MDQFLNEFLLTSFEENFTSGREVNALPMSVNPALANWKSRLLSSLHQMCVIFLLSTS